MSPEPFDSRAEALLAKRWEKGYGDENVLVCNNKTIPYYSPIVHELIVNLVALLENDHLKYCFSFSDLLVYRKLYLNNENLNITATTVVIWL